MVAEAFENGVGRGGTTRSPDYQTVAVGFDPGTVHGVEGALNAVFEGGVSVEFDLGGVAFGTDGVFADLVIAVGKGVLQSGGRESRS